MGVDPLDRGAAVGGGIGEQREYRLLRRLGGRSPIQLFDVRYGIAVGPVALPALRQIKTDAARVAHCVHCMLDSRPGGPS